MKMTWSKLCEHFSRAMPAGNIGWKALLAFASLIALGSVLYVALPAKGIVLEVGLPNEPIIIGEPFELEVRLINNSQSVLKNARVALGLPKGLALFEDAQKVNVIKDVGEAISMGAGTKTVFTLIALPAEGADAYLLSASATYTLGSLSADFTKRA